MDRIYVSNSALTTAGLAIVTASSTQIKTVNNVNYKIDGVLYTAATAGTANTPVFTIPTLTTTPITVSVNAAGSLTLTPGTGVLTATIIASSANAIVQRSQLAEVPASQALVGYVVVKNAAATSWVGGTTAFDATSVTSTYINVPMATTL